jgi:hypothetical protein
MPFVAIRASGEQQEGQKVRQQQREIDKNDHELHRWPAREMLPGENSSLGNPTDTSDMSKAMMKEFGTVSNRYFTNRGPHKQKQMVKKWH